jgi:hypothetical protein
MIITLNYIWIDFYNDNQLSMFVQIKMASIRQHCSYKLDMARPGPRFFEDHYVQNDTVFCGVPVV